MAISASKSAPNFVSIDDTASAHSSSSISSPPVSPHYTGFSDTIRVAPNPRFLPGEGVVPAPPPPAQAPYSASAQATSSNRGPTSGSMSANNTNHATVDDLTPSEKPKRQRRKKDADPDGKTADDEKPKKTRKPRESKDKAGNSSNTTAAPNTAASRKKQKLENASKDATPPVTFVSRQPNIADMIASIPAPAPSVSLNKTDLIPARPASATPVELSRSNPNISINSAPLVRSASRGQNYDPVRGFTMEAAAQTRPPIVTAITAPSPMHVNRASASPSIASLIDPPMISTPAAVYSPQTAASRNNPPAPPVVIHSHPPSPQAPQRSNPTPISSLISSAPALPNPGPAFKSESGMDIDTPEEKSLSKPSIPLPDQDARVQSKSSSPIATPKVARTADTSAPKGTGSGLLSSSNLFGGPAANGEPTERKGVNIDIQISLNPNGGNIINMAQEIAKKYGRDAINPRAAAHRERLLAVAAAANKIEGLNGDEMSVDGTSDPDIDSNAEMGGMDDDKSATGADSSAKPIKKRRRKLEEYDKEDDFIDDTELAWQEQAAVSKDGFFVYSGPLVTAGQDAQIESSAPSRGRGRGRGRGSRGGAAASHASVAEKSKDANALQANGGRGRGRARGTGTTRKPRVNKADRERLEAEKAERARPEPPVVSTPAAQSTPYTQPLYLQSPAGTVA